MRSIRLDRETATSGVERSRSRVRRKMIMRIMKQQRPGREMEPPWLEESLPC